MASEEKKKKPEADDNTGKKPAQTGNASNPSPGDGLPDNHEQLLDKKAEKYLRESGNIEDMPDAEEEEDNK